MYRASDGNGTSNLASVSIEVGPTNEAPLGMDDGYSVNEDETLDVNAETGVLANDTDGNGDALTAVLVSTTSGGVLNLSDDGSFDYAPGTDFNGSDQFTYCATDGDKSSNTATVTRQPCTRATSRA